MRSNLQALQNTVTLLDRTQNRLSTGKKVNTAMDNPVSYFAAQALNSRAAIIDGLKDAMGQAVQTITAADKGITALSTMIEQAKGLAQSAQSAAAGTTPDAVVDADATVSNVTYATVSFSATTAAAGTMADETIVIGTVTFVATDGTVGAGEVAFDGTAADLADKINASTTLSTYTAAAAGDVITLEETDSDVAVGDVTGTALDGAVAIDQQHAETWAITANLITTTTVGAGDTAAAAQTAAAAALQTDLLARADVATATVTGATDGIDITFDYVPSAEMTSIVGQYNTLRTQMDELAEDSGYKGKNLLSSDTMTVKFEGTTLDVVGFDASTTGLGLTAADAAVWGATPAAIDTAITALDAASVTLRSEASKLSGNLSIITVRQSFSTNMINTLNSGSDLLTLADSNEEGANMLMLQTRQSLSTTALSLSAQAAQSVLKLFG
jgi:flagellin-like hook-associated protein FlgL